MALRNIFSDFKITFDARALAAGVQAADRAVLALEKLDAAVKKVTRDEDMFAAATRRATNAGNQQYQANKANEETWRSSGTFLAQYGEGLAGAAAAGLAVAYGLERAGEAVFNWANQLRIAGELLGDVSDRTGVNTTDLQVWQLQARLNGSSAEAMNGALERLNVALGQSGAHGNRAAQDFRRLGVETHNADGSLRDIGAILEDAADPLSRLSESQRAAFLMRNLGREGRRLGPVFAQGAEGIRAAREELQRLGGGASPEMIQRSREMGDSIDRFDTALFSLKATLVETLLPPLTRIIESLSGMIATLTAVAQHSYIVKAALIALGVVCAALAVVTAVVWVPILVLSVLVVAAIAAVILVVEDLVALFSGGRSIIGSFWNGILEGIEETINAWRELVGLPGITLAGRAGAGEFSALTNASNKTAPKGGGQITAVNQVTVNTPPGATAHDIAIAIRTELDRQNAEVMEAEG